ncbi:aminotransferase class V-fold PLP-dependent enzyme [uncultured Clostridium sp.]|jgi:arginine/lysine/ornithine decarboxylase|uniref:aminotransferase class I/II-fold pyridoxal phosphate-dependent enzyme n=1 Tax=uncultured Clostridium sp. TaxID=59620 RepID=UPI00261BD029|nr:aminotransferase class V-fold PLP-dependent enzyme [uncultured Clostridium sp.]
MIDEVLKELPLIKVIDEYLKEDIAPFSMPGHKYSKAFFGDNLAELFLKGDITEFDGTDNLHKPEGCIKESQDKLSNIYGSEESYFLVNGSTSGNLIMIFAAFNEGDKIIIERNCHRSIMNAIVLRKLVPIFVKNIIHDEFKAPISIDRIDLERVVSENPDARGIILTYPYYYGVGIDVASTISFCKENKLKVLVDSAHGAHFGFNDRLPMSAQNMGADIVIMSAHKTLPSLTQTAYMHVNDRSLVGNVELYKGMFLSTSPSYMFLMSLEYSRYFLEYKAFAKYNSLLDRINNFKSHIKNLEYVTVVDREFFASMSSEIELDESRIVLHVSKGLSGHKLLDYLRENKVQAEMSDERNVILIPSPFNTDKDFEMLEKALLNCDKSVLIGEEKGFYDLDIPEMVMIPSEALIRNKKSISIDECEGCICGDTIIAYPPGVPLLMMGERIESRHIEFMKKYIADGVTLIGVDNYKLLVVTN